MSTPEDSEKSAVLKCTCALPAKLRLSDTPKNPFRLFYNCSKGIPDVSTLLFSCNWKIIVKISADSHFFFFFLNAASNVVFLAGLMNQLQLVIYKLMR